MRKQVLFFAAVSIFAAAACKKNNGSGSNIQIVDFEDGAPRDSVIFIYGHGFGKKPAENVVSFSGTVATVVGASDTMLYVKVPRLAPSGRITVQANGGKAETGSDFNYVYTVSTFAGTGSKGATNGTGTAASFYKPWGMCADPSGNIYVADASNAHIRKITPAGVVTNYDHDNNKNSLLYTYDVVYGKDGNVYVADVSQIWKVDINGQLTVIAGDTSGFADGKGKAALFNSPNGIAIDKSGNLIVADSYNNRIRKVAPDGTVTTIAGKGTAGHVDGPAISAAFNYPLDVAVAPDGSIYVADGDYTIRKIATNGNVSTMAGSPGNYGSADGTGSAAKLGNVNQLFCDEKGLVYFTDDVLEGVRTMDANGKVTFFCGRGFNTYMDGLQSFGGFNYPGGIVKTSDGTIYVADSRMPRMRKID